MKWPEYPDDMDVTKKLPPDTRPDWDEYFLRAAVWASQRGDCTRRRIGAVIVWGQRIWATGYNGTPEPGEAGCLDGACPRGRKSAEELPAYSGDYSDCIAYHAEANAIQQFDYVRRHLEITTKLRSDWGCPLLYVSAPPCLGCRELIADNGIGAYWRE